MDNLYIVIPAYNEEENIRKVVEEWYLVVKQYDNGSSRLVVIDDGSNDKTYDILCEIAQNCPLLIPLIKKNEGHGATVLYGYNYALKNGADYIFQTDSDGQTVPAEFDAFWRLRKQYDMIIGYRNKRQDGFSRIVVTKTLKIVIKLCFGVNVCDANTPFRLMEAKRLNQCIKKVPDGFNLSNVIISVIYIKNNLKVKYLPITFKARQGGINSINFRKIFKIASKAVKDFWIIRKTLYIEEKR